MAPGAPGASARAGRLSARRTAPLDCWAITPPGVEAITAGELRALGLVPGDTEPGGVAFRADHTGLAAANLGLRTASRIVVRIGRFRAAAFHELEKRARTVPWASVVAPGSTVAFRVTSRKSRLYHQRAIAERLLESVARAVPGVTAGRAAAEDGDDAEAPADGGGPAPALLVVVRVLHDEVTISADSSGEHLHRRGWRLATAKAPLRETLAAAMLLASGWPGTAPLVDPFCGSGTIPIEAALLARRIAPGLGRAFAAERWPSVEAAAWAAARARAREAVRPAAGVPIVGADRDAGAIEASRANAERAGVAGDVEFRRAPIGALAPPPGAGWLVTNPPWGARVGEADRLRDLYATFGRVVRERLAGWQVALLAADRRLPGHAGLAWRDGFATTSGGIRVRLLLAPGG